MLVKSRLARISAATALVVLTIGVGAPHATASTASEDLPNDEVLVGVEVEGQELDEDLPIPGEPEDLVVPDLDLPDKEPEDFPHGIECKPGWFFKITENKKNTMSVKYQTFVENKTSRSLDFKFTSKKSGTTEVGGSFTLSAEAKVAVLGSIKAEINVNAKKSWTSEIGVETYGKVPAKSIVYGDYGILKENVYGYKYYRGSACQKANKQYMTVWAPYREGWRIR
ncbi:hypothetical protein ACSR0Z_37915 (plasmid) [Streptomyces viridosporus]|uniref:hypothetical protein n=1 Tax=Streptomyces sp. NWU49 TaxID=2201153 RepID=UPI0015E815BF|nr:hypothetical protein [Streptomyces sp. NWU49]